jgi:hypothetical protein
VRIRVSVVYQDQAHLAGRNVRTSYLTLDPPIISNTLITIKVPFNIGRVLFLRRREKGKPEIILGETTFLPNFESDDVNTIWAQQYGCYIRVRRSLTSQKKNGNPFCVRSTRSAFEQHTYVFGSKDVTAFV